MKKTNAIEIANKLVSQSLRKSGRLFRGKQGVYGIGMVVAIPS